MVPTERRGVQRILSRPNTLTPLNAVAEYTRASTRTPNTVG